MDQLLENEACKRKFIRYVRKDIKASISRTSFLGFKETIDCKLLDISTAGAQLSSSIKLKKNTRITLILDFGESKELQLQSHIVHHKVINHYLSIHIFPTIKVILKNKAASLKNLHLYESNKKIIAKYRDLSFSSVKILTHTQLNKKERHSLVFNLNDGEQYKTSTEIDCSQHFRCNSYGVKFDNLSDKLGEYMLETQTDLVFK